jgi:hypothetical protein
MTRVPKMIRGKSFFPRDIQCYPLFYISFARLATLYCTEYIYIYIYIYISYCVEIVYELPLIPNSNNFTQIGSGAKVDWIFITWTPAWRLLGEYVTLEAFNRSYFAPTSSHGHAK